MIGRVAVGTVVYNTPDLLERWIGAVETYLPGHPVYVVDGSSEKHVPRHQKILDGKAKHAPMGFNIHHGPGIEYVISWAWAEGAKQMLILDTDAFVTGEGLLEELQPEPSEEWIFSGHVCHVNETGGHEGITPYRYPHPSICLINLKTYYDHELRYARHGAPALYIATKLHILGKEHMIRGVDTSDKVDHCYRGTVNSTGGYNL